METLDLGLVQINGLQDFYQSMILESFLSPSIEILKCYLAHCKSIEISVKFANGISDEKTIYIEPNNKMGYHELSQIAEQIIKNLLKQNIKSCYQDWLDTLTSYLYYNHLEWNEQAWSQVFLKEICTSNGEHQNENESLEKELSIGYFFKKYQGNFLNALCQKEEDIQRLKEEAFAYYKEKYYRRKNEIKTPQDIVYYIWNNIQYGWIDQEGKYHSEIESSWKTSYVLPTVEDILKTHVGCCIDETRVAQVLLENLGYSTMNRFVKTEANGKMYYHAYTLYQKDESWYRLDCESDDFPSITHVKTIKQDEIWTCEKSPKNKLIFTELPKDIDGLSIEKVIEIAFGKTRSRKKEE